MKTRSVYAKAIIQVFIPEWEIEEAVELAHGEGVEVTEDEAFLKLVDFAIDEQISGALKLRDYEIIPGTEK